MQSPRPHPPVLGEPRLKGADGGGPGSQKKGKSYLLSNLGFIQKNTLDWMGKTLRCLKDHKDFFLSHDLSGIPRAFQVTLGVVCETPEIIENDMAMSNHIQEEIIIPLLARSRQFLVASYIWFRSTSSPSPGLSKRKEASRPSHPIGSSRS